MSGTKGFTGTQIQCVTGSVVKKYDVKKRLGSGGFADVYLVKSVDSGKVYACKFISKNSIESKRHAEKIKSELKIHAGCGINNVLENKFIVEFGRYWDDKEYIYILMNHCCNGSLEGWLTKRRTTTEAESRYTIKQITLGVKYLHEKFHVIHRDLKLGNILFDENMNIKICDFGLAAEIKQEAKKFTMCGTPNYIAPEIASGINNSAGNAGHSYGVDVWAIGVMTYTLLFGTPPFQTKNIAKTCDKIKKSQFKFPWKPKISDSAKDLIKKILTVDADKRLTIKGILKHGFFKTLPVPKNLPECCLHRVPTEEELFPDVCATEMTKRFNDTCVNVVKFVDYSSKYGIGYILSNGFTGVLFNDNSSLILPINKVFIYFIDMNGVGTSYAYKQFANKQIDNASVKKRFEIFMQIAKVIWKDFTLNNEIINIPVIKSEKDIIYVRKWKRTDYAMIFKFNDQVIQTLFKDDTVVAVKSGSGSGSGSATKNEEDENNNSNSNGSGSGSKSTSVTFMRQHRNVFEQFPSYTQFKKEASREMQAYVEHIQFSLLNKEN